MGLVGLWADWPAPTSVSAVRELFPVACGAVYISRQLVLVDRSWLPRSITMARKQSSNPDLAEQSAALAEFAAKALVAADQLGNKKKAIVDFPLSEPERAIAAGLPAFACRPQAETGYEGGGHLHLSLVRRAFVGLHRRAGGSAHC